MNDRLAKINHVLDKVDDVMTVVLSVGLVLLGATYLYQTL